MPLGAATNSSAFSYGACGAWSLPIVSMTPSASAARTARRSDSVRSGGYILASAL